MKRFVLAAILLGNLHPAAAIDICDPTISNPHLIRECLLSEGWKNPTQDMINAVAAARRAADPQAKAYDEATELANALVPDGSHGSATIEGWIRDGYRQDILKHGKARVAICAAGGKSFADDYQQCLKIGAALAR